jgi:cytochrome P450
MYVAHMNPEYFDEPELFKPERWLEGYEPAPALDAFYPFSAGYVHCDINLIAHIYSLVTEIVL